MNSGKVQELVALFVERREAGDKTTPEEFATSHAPDNEELLGALKRVQATEEFLGRSGLPTERLGPYRMLELIGSGGMGRVYRAVHDELPDGEVALKILAPLVMDDEKTRVRFEREARALVGLDHSGVVRVLDHGIVGGVPYLAMEWVRGPTLAEVLEEARDGHSKELRRPPSEALALGGESAGHRSVASVVGRLARAVAAVHSSGVLHRDIKPGNVILRDGSNPVLVDFGLARADETISLTGTGDLLGTPRYMAPEQARGDETDVRTDVHGLGLLLYELLTLKSPRPGGEPVSVLRLVAEQPMPAANRTDPSIPNPLNRIVGRACAFRSAARYATAAELALDLEAFVAQTAIQARRFSLWERLQNAWVLRRKTLVATVAGLIVLGALPFLLEKPPDLDQLIERAALAYAADDLAGTAANAQQILTHDPEHEVGLFLEGLASDNFKGYEDSPFLQALVDGLVHTNGMVWPQALESFERAQELEPGSPLPQVLVKRTRTLMAQQQAEHEPGDTEKPPETAAGWYELGLLRNGQQRFARAEQALEQALELDPSHRDAWIQLCRAQFYQGQAERAAATAARAGREAGTGYVNTLLRSEGRAVAGHARDILTRILQSNPSYVRAMRMMGYTYDYEHQVTEARRWYERALELAPTSYEELGNLAFLLAGSRSGTCQECADWFAAHPSELNIEKSRKLYLRQLQLDRGSTRISSSACEAIARLGSTQEAQELILKMLQDDAELGDPVRRNGLQKALDNLRR